MEGRREGDEVERACGRPVVFTLDFSEYQLRMRMRMIGENLSSVSRDGSASGEEWGTSGSRFVPQGDVGYVLDGGGGGVAGGSDNDSDDSANIAWGVALVAAPIMILLLLLSLRSAVAQARRESVGADKKSEGRQERYRSVEEREGGYGGIASPDPAAVYVHVHGGWQQWTQVQTTDGGGDKSLQGQFERPPRSSSLEDFRDDTHLPGNPDVIWRNTTYSF
jgi:hypothetical protein